jgi:hypothetical protein
MPLHMLLAQAGSGSGSSVDLAGSWQTLWSSINGSIGGLLKILGIVGLLLVVGSVLKWLWERRRGGVGGGLQAHSNVLFTAVLGALLAAPNFMVPWILTVLDTIVNAIASIGNSL